LQKRQQIRIFGRAEIMLTKSTMRCDGMRQTNTPNLQWHEWSKLNTTTFERYSTALFITTEER